MKFRYIGEAPNGPFEMYGAMWSVGAEAAVDDPALVAKLRANRFFEPVDGQPATDHATEPAAGNPSELDAARMRAAGLGIKVDGRWSLAKINKMIEAEESA